MQFSVGQQRQEGAAGRGRAQQEALRGEEEEGLGVSVRLAEREVGTQTNLSKPTYLDSLIASLLGTVSGGKNCGYVTGFKTHYGLVGF